MSSGALQGISAWIAPRHICPDCSMPEGLQDLGPMCSCLVDMLDNVTLDMS